MKMEIGSTLYLYTARNGKFHVYEGMIVENKRRFYMKHVVRFDGRTQLEYPPTDKQIGRVLGGGPRLWLLERDDNLARKLFLEYEEEKLKQLEKQYNKKVELIRVLKEGLE